MASRAIHYVLMGYSVTQKGYKLYDLAEKRFFVSRDVVFNESIFPFGTGRLDQLSIFF